MKLTRRTTDNPNEEKTFPRKKFQVKREGRIITFSLLLITLLTWAEIKIARLRAPVQLESKIFVFGLINIIILLIIFLVYLVFRNIAKLFIERRQNAAGAKLRTKLVLAFVSLSLVPTMLLFFVSAGFITNSIDNWFSDQVEASMNESMAVVQIYYKTYAANALDYAQQLSAHIKEEKLLNSENLAALREFIQMKQKEYNRKIRMNAELLASAG